MGELECPVCGKDLDLPDCPWGADVYCSNCGKWWETDNDVSCSEDGDESWSWWIVGKAEDQNQKVETE